VLAVAGAPKKFLQADLPADGLVKLLVS
jgi:hypothetical protein